jgi:hypothetical protein
MTARENVTIGPARIFVADAGTALPTRSNLTALKGGTFSGWSELGHTASAITLTETPNVVTVTSQQAGRPLDAYISSYDTHVVTTLRETTAGNVALAFRGTVTGTTVKAGDHKRVPVKAVVIVGPWHGGDEVIITAGRVSLAAETNLAFDAENGTEIPVDFVVMDNGNADDYQILLPADAPSGS